MYYDLHIHSNKSDGKYPRIELLKKAKDLNLEYLSFTDHDYIDNEKIIDEFKKIYGECTVKLIEGIEFNVDDYKKMHILGYGIKDKELIIKNLEEIKKENEDICKRLINNLNNFYGFNLDIDEYRDSALTKGLIRKMLVDKNIATNIKEAGDLYTGSNSKFYEKTKALKMDKVISLILDSGGVPVLAHPQTLQLSNEDLNNLIKKMKEKGLMGLEVLNLSKNTKVKEEYYELLAAKYNLLTSCGSDFHDENNTPLFGVDNEKSKLLIKKIKEM